MLTTDGLKMPRLNLNLLYFAPCELHEGVGGSARLENMVFILQQLGLNIQLVSYIPKDEFRVEHENISNFLGAKRIYIPKSAPRFFKTFAIPLVLMYGLKYAKRSDVIFAHAPGIMSGFPALIFAKMFNKPLIIDHMDVKDPDTPRFIYDKVLRGSTIVFAISHYLEEEVKSKHGGEAFYVPIFIDTNIFQKDLRKRKIIRERLGLVDKEILIGYAGSFSYVEGVPVLLKAFKNLIEKYEDIRLIVIGEMNVGSDNIPQIIDEFSLREKVIQIPRQPRKNIPNYLSACDILCSPKIDCEINRAANPVKVFEYLSMNLPTVCSAVGGIIDTIKDKFNGLLVKPGDIKDLEEKLEWIILHPERAKEIGENGRKTVIENYSYKAIRDKIKSIIINIINIMMDTR